MAHGPSLYTVGRNRQIISAIEFFSGLSCLLPAQLVSAAAPGLVIYYPYELSAGRPDIVGAGGSNRNYIPCFLQNLPKITNR